MPVIKTYFGFYQGVGGGEEYRAFIRSRLPPELKGGCESSSHRLLDHVCQQILQKYNS